MTHGHNVASRRRFGRKPLRISTASVLAIFGLIAGEAQAAQLLYSPDGTADGAGAIDTALPLSKIEGVPLQRGTFTVHGNIAEITTVPEWQFDHRSVLDGRVLDTRKTGAPGRASITGIIFFDAGEWIGYFDDKSAVETITTDKGTLAGRITGLSNLDLELTQLNGQHIAVPLSSVRELRSPRAFRFQIPLSGIATSFDFSQKLELDAATVSLSPIGRTFRLASLKTLVHKQSEDGDISTAKLAVMGSAVSLLNMAQLAPLLGITLGAEPTLRRRAFFKDYQFNSSSISPSPSPAPAPSPSSM
jgi:hypothetical protein